VGVIFVETIPGCSRMYSPRPSWLISKTESLEIFDPLIDKMNPSFAKLYYDEPLVGRVSRQYVRPKMETRLETRMLPPQSSVQGQFIVHEAHEG
jgi:hypothetical protein